MSAPVSPPTTEPAPAPASGVGEVIRALGRGFASVFAPLLRFLDAFGGHLMLAGRALSWLPRRPYRFQNYLEAGEYIGFGSLPIVLLVGAFTGMVMSLQFVFAFGQFKGMEVLAGAITGKALALELAPVLTCLMLAGRAGSGIATEIGTMRISEQIDAMESMAVNPIQYLILPRIVAGAIVAPMLALLFFCIGMAGAYLVAVLGQGVDEAMFLTQIKELLRPVDIIQGLIKASVFGFVVTLIGCYQGFNASGGGRGVGIGTTRAVVSGSVCVLVFDYFLTDVLLTLMPPIQAL